MPGDRITAIDGEDVDSLGALLAKLDDRKVGNVVKLTVSRGEAAREVPVELEAGT